jgi:SAM-dependent methyltransferase
MNNRRVQALARWLLTFIDVKRLRSIIYLPRYLSHWNQYSHLTGRRLLLAESYPCLSDWVDSTPFDSHYIFQSAWLSRELSANQPKYRHVDIGSDIRMIVSISAFLEVEFIDYRPLNVTLPSLHCFAGNITSLNYADETLESVSSLHVVEHIGLGRYGDPLNSTGSEQALAELARVVAQGGRLYVSVPVGRETVCFNAHRIFAPDTIIRAVSPLSLISFALVTDAGKFISPANPKLALDQKYGCGMFVFERQANHGVLNTQA